MSNIYLFSFPDAGCIGCIRPTCDALTALKNPLLYKIVPDGTAKTLLIEADEQLSEADLLTLVSNTAKDLGQNVQLRPPSFWQKLKKMHLLWAVLGLSSGAVILLLTMFAGLPFLALIAMGGVSLVLTVIVGYESFTTALTKLRYGRLLTMDTLFSLSTLLVLGISIVALFVPGLSMMFEAGLLIFGFRHLGLWIQQTVKEKLVATHKLFDRLPKKVKTDEGELTLLDVQVGQILQISKNEFIPCDGIAFEECWVDESILRGSCNPKRYQAGALLIQGMRLVSDTSLQLTVQKTASNSYLSRLDEAILRAQFEKAPIEEMSAKLLQYFIPTVFIIAILASTTVGVFFTPLLAVQCFSLIIVAACPCTLGLIIPLAVKIGMQKGQESGVRFKSAKTLQAAADIDTIFLDLHGTLTEGKPKVTRTNTHDSKVLAYMASLEKMQPHAYAKAIREKAVRLITPEASDVETVFGGVKGMIDQELYYVGNRALMASLGIDTFEFDKNLHCNIGECPIYLVKEKTILGAVIIADPLKCEALSFVRGLKKLGKSVVLCTGADASFAKPYACYLGIDVIKTNARPEDKKNHIEALQKSGKRVAMIGDGINDMLAMTASHFSIAIESPMSDPVTENQAGAYVRERNLLPILGAFEIANQTVNNVKQNLSISLLYNLGGLFLTGGLLIAFGFMLHPGIGVALMVVQTSLVLVNSYRFKQQALTVTNGIKKTGIKLNGREFVARSERRLGLGPTPAANVGLRPNLRLGVENNTDVPSVFDGIGL